MAGLSKVDPKGQGTQSPSGNQPPQGHDNSSTNRETKEWTIMFYFASDNPLASEVVSQLKAIKEAGFHPQANVIAQFDPEDPASPRQIYDVNLINKLRAGETSNVGFRANDPYVRNLVADKLWGGPLDGPEQQIRTDIAKHLAASRHPIKNFDPPIPPPEMDGEADPKAALCQFLEFCRVKYPASHYALILLGHGLVVGNDIFLYQEDADGSIAPARNRRQHAGEVGTNEPQMSGCTANPSSRARNSLLLRDLGEILNKFTEKVRQAGSEFEFIGFHACSMSGIEVAYEIRNTAKYMLASQGPAFVGSWPYREILIHMFNNLDAVSFRGDDLINPDGIIQTVQNTPSGPLGQCLLNALSKTTDLLNRYDSIKELVSKGDKSGKISADLDSQPMPLEIRTSLQRDLNGLLSNPALGVFLPAKVTSKLSTMGLMWAKRRFLENIFGPAIAARCEPTVEIAVKSIFDYCVYNSYDFQLAGYSYDMCLCDLTKLRDDAAGSDDTNASPAIPKGVDIKASISALAGALTAGIPDTLALKVITLAHWDAQSYWGEQYTDLFDLCARLLKRCGEVQPYAAATLTTKQILNSIESAARSTMEALKGDPKKWEFEVTGCPLSISTGSPAAAANPQQASPSHPPCEYPPPRAASGGLIMHSAFVGPVYQYSNGLSVLFPWSKPDQGFFPTEYQQYAFSQTGWTEFLSRYFQVTQRQAREVNIGQGHLDTDLLALLQRISAEVFNPNAELGEGGVKGGPGDPAGSACECPTIKNYPTYTQSGEHFPITPDLSNRLKEDVF